MCAMRVLSNTLQGARDALPAGAAPDSRPISRIPASLLGPSPHSSQSSTTTTTTTNVLNDHPQHDNNSANPNHPLAPSVPNELITAINMYCRFCKEVSVRNKDLPQSFVKMILVFQKNVNVRAAYNTLFPFSPLAMPSAANHSFIDWARISLLGKDRAYMDTTSWIRVLASYTVVDISDTDLRALLREQPVLQHYHECMLEAKLVGPLASDRAAHLVYLYLLVNIQRLQSLHAVEQFYSINHNADRRTEALLFFSKLANRQFDRELQTNALVTLLSRFLKVRSEWIQQELELLELREKELAGLFHQKTIRAMSGRPRLRSRLRAITAASGSLFTMDQLAQWNGSIRFPNVFSMIQRKRLYFLMSQVHLDPAECIHLVLRDRDLALSVLRYPVKQPETEVLYECITGCSITSDPFPELHHFRACCFDGFAYEHKTRLRLNDLLHLFISAYQNPSVWKTLWKLVFPVLSIQIIRDVEAFVGRVPFPARAVLGTMFEIHQHPPLAPPPSSQNSHHHGSSNASNYASQGPQQQQQQQPQQRPPAPPSSQQASQPPPPRVLSISPVSPFNSMSSLSLLFSPAPSSPGSGAAHGAEGPKAHGIVGELDDSQHLVRDGEPALDHGLPKGIGQPAPLEHDGAPEPPGLELGVPLVRGDAAHGDPAQPHHIEDEHPGEAGLQKELAAEDARGRALVGDDAQLGVPDVAHVA